MTFDPSTVAGLHLWEAAPAYCFSDAAGTVPCAVGDPVRCWKARYGGALDLTPPDPESSGGKLGIDDDGFYYFGDENGASSLVGSLAFASWADKSLLGAFRASAQGFGATLVKLQDDSFNAFISAVNFDFGTSSYPFQATLPGSFSAAASQTTVDGTAYVFALTMGADRALSAWLNGSALSATGSGPPGVITGQSVMAGSAGVSAKTYGLAVVTTALSAQDRAGLEEYLLSLMQAAPPPAGGVISQARRRRRRAHMQRGE